MINRDDMTPEQREVYDKTYLGAVDRLDRELTQLKRVMFDALPYAIQRLIAWLRSR